SSLRHAPQNVGYLNKFLLASAKTTREGDLFKVVGGNVCFDRWFTFPTLECTILFTKRGRVKHHGTGEVVALPDVIWVFHGDARLQHRLFDGAAPGKALVEFMLEPAGEVVWQETV